MTASAIGSAIVAHWHTPSNARGKCPGLQKICSGISKFSWPNRGSYRPGALGWPAPTPTCRCLHPQCRWSAVPHLHPALNRPHVGEVPHLHPGRGRSPAVSRPTTLRLVATSPQRPVLRPALPGVPGVVGARSGHAERRWRARPGGSGGLAGCRHGPQSGGRGAPLRRCSRATGLARPRFCWGAAARSGSQSVYTSPRGRTTWPTRKRPRGGCRSPRLVPWGWPAYPARRCHRRPPAARAAPLVWYCPGWPLAPQRARAGPRRRGTERAWERTGSRAVVGRGRGRLQPDPCRCRAPREPAQASLQPAIGCRTRCTPWRQTDLPTAPHRRARAWPCNPRRKRRGGAGPEAVAMCRPRGGGTHPRRPHRHRSASRAARGPGQWRRARPAAGVPTGFEAHPCAPQPADDARHEVATPRQPSCRHWLAAPRTRDDAQRPNGLARRARRRLGRVGSARRNRGCHKRP
jgi:hypothetical protein